jgi:hypothetical protein
MCLPEPKPPRAEIVHAEAICCGSLKRHIDVDRHTGTGADTATARYQIANPRRHVSLRVLLRLTAMDVCCGPPASVPAFLIAF